MALKEVDEQLTHLAEEAGSVPVVGIEHAGEADLPGAAFRVRRLTPASMQLPRDVGADYEYFCTEWFMPEDNRSVTPGRK